MSKLILSSHEPSEIFISNIPPNTLIDLSDKVFVSKYRNKSRIKLIQDAKAGNERNYRFILIFKVGLLFVQLQSFPIPGDMVKSYGFAIDDTIEKYEEIGEMLKAMR